MKTFSPANRKQIMSPKPANQSLPSPITTEFLNALRKAGVVEASLFGSWTRGKAVAESDIDLLVKFDRDVSLFEQLDLAFELTRISGFEVDLMTSINPVFEPYIRPTLVSISL